MTTVGGRRKLERVKKDQPSRWLGDEVEIKPTRRTVCAICFWSHASILLNDNTYHKPCLEAMKSEYHTVPAGLEKDGFA